MVTMMGRDNNLCGLSMCEVSLGVFHLRPFLEFLFFLSSFQSTQLFLGHKLTASRAQEMGLVSESIWPATYQQELIPKVALLATHSAQVGTCFFINLFHCLGFAYSVLIDFFFLYAQRSFLSLQIFSY